MTTNTKEHGKFMRALKKVYKKHQDKGGANTPLDKTGFYHVLEAYFRNDYREALINHHLESYNYFIKYGIAKIIKNYNPIKFLVENKHSDLTEISKKIKFFEHTIEFAEVCVRKPSISVGCRKRRILYPNECRIRNATYQADIYATVRHSMKMLDEQKLDINPKAAPKSFEIKNVKIGSLPVMLHSILCSLYQMSDSDLRRIAREDPNDLGGYFIVNGSEKVLISQEKKISNHVTFYTNPKKTYPYVCEIKCTKEDTYGAPSTATVKMNKKDKILFSLSPGFAPDVNIPIFIMFKALGIVDDKSILEYIMYDSKDDTMLNLLKPSMYQRILQADATESEVVIQTKEQALNYIAEKIRARKPSIFLTRGIGIEDRHEKSQYMLNVFSKHLFPHIKSNDNLKIKAFFLGYMCNKLLLGRQKLIREDDRDNYALKRVDTAGVLISQLFYQSFSVFIAKMKDNIRRESTSKNFKATELEAMIQRAVPESEIESKHKKAFSTGEWTVSRTAGGSAKQGVAQLLQRLTPVNTISALRRLVTPQTQNQKAKPEIRRVHGTHWGVACVTGDTEVLLGDGITTCPIKDLGKKSVLTVNKNDLTKEPSQNEIFHIVDEPGPLYEITTEGGKKLKCTPDHPLLVDNDINKFIQAADLNVGDGLITLVRMGKKPGVNAYSQIRGFDATGHFIYKVDPIKSIKEIESETVYDITTVSQNHSFVANSIISSNCCVETPEGPSIGMVKNLAMLTKITTSSSPQFVLELLDKMDDVIPLEKLSPSSIKNYTKIFVNGDWLACTGSPKMIVDTLRRYRRKIVIPPSTSIVRDFITNEVRVYTDAGRCIRPLYIVDSGNKLRMNDKVIADLRAGKMQWVDLIKQEYIEYIGVQEAIHNGLIAMYPGDLVDPQNKLKRYSHCEIHPITILGTAASLIPFCQHNQSPRNLFQCAQCKQALSIYALNYRDRMDTMGHVLYYPQRPFVTTCMSKFVRYDDVPAGQNVMVAIMSYTGFNQEDSVIVNKASIERGLQRSTYYKMYKEELKSNEDFRKPNPQETSKYKRHFNYDLLAPYGFPPPNTHIKKDDIVIGKIRKLDNREQYGSFIYKDASIPLKDRKGVIDEIKMDKNQDGNRFAKVRIRMERIVNIGDKFACARPDTDILTDRGWIAINKLTKKHKVATLVNDQYLVYEHPKKLFEYDYDGDMYSLESQQINLFVTPNHKLYVQKRNRDYYELIEAKDVFGKRVRHRRDAIFKGKKYKNMVLPQVNGYPKRTIKMDSWLQFFGVWLAEGCVAKKSSSVCVAANKQRVKDLIQNIEPDMNIKPHNNKDINRYSFCDKTINMYLRQFGKALNKYLPDWCFDLCPEQAEILLRAMLCGDGYHTKSNTLIYYTSSKQLADDVQRLALHVGWSANVRARPGLEAGTVWKMRGTSGTTNADALAVVINRSKNRPQINHGHHKTQNGQKEEWVHFKGKVYCCETSSGVIYTRRKGVPCWNGNSRHGKLLPECGIKAMLVQAY